MGKTDCYHNKHVSLVPDLCKVVELYRRKEGNVLFNDAFNTFLFTVIWRQAYGKGPLK